MSACDLTAEIARDLYSYDPTTGRLTYRENRGGKIKKGALAGTFRAEDGRQCVAYRGKKIYAYRIIWLMVHGAWPSGEIDHINGDPTDNRLSNLRDVTPSLNQQNHRVAHKGKMKDAPLGVSWSSQNRKWRSCITLNRKLKTLGYFDSQDEAHRRYLEAKRELHPACTI